MLRRILRVRLFRWILEELLLMRVLRDSCFWCKDLTAAMLGEGSSCFLVEEDSEKMPC